jgi:SHS2 domain-containing protein
MASKPPYHEVPHTADRAFRVRGRDLAEIFTCAAQAMFAWQRRPAVTAATRIREVHVSGVDREALLVKWLNELLYLQETYGECYSRFDVAEISDTALRAYVEGARCGAASRRTIKAVTFHDLKIKRLPRGWETTVVVDV